MSVSISLALMALASFQQTDTTIAVSPDARLDLTNHAGLIVVSAWDRDAIRVRAEHGSRDRIVIETRGSVVTIRARRRYGRSLAVDYELTVPATMSLSLDGIEAEIEVTGVHGDISAETIEGDIVVRRGGSMNLSTIEGDIHVEGATGRVRAHGVDGDIDIRDVTGDVTAETIDGDVTLDGIDASDVDVSTVDGDLFYRGSIRDGGRYRFTSHDGDVTLAVPITINATVSVATFDGAFEAGPAFRVQISAARPGRRFSFVLGTGSARVELESFDGLIQLRRQ